MLCGGVMKIGETEKEKAAREKISTVAVKVAEVPGFKAGWMQSVKFEMDTDLVKISDSLTMQKLIGVDIEKTFTALVDAGSLLQIALNKAGTEPCSTNIVECIALYQKTVANNEVKTKGFTTASLTALSYHQNALTTLDYATKPKEYANALDLLKGCITIAENMVVVSNEMVVSAEGLHDSAAKALVQAQADAVANNKLSAEIKEKISELEVERDSSQARYKSLLERLEQAEADEEKAAAAAERARERQFTMGIVSACTGAFAAVGKTAVAVASTVYGAPARAAGAAGAAVGGISVGLGGGAVAPADPLAVIEAIDKADEAAPGADAAAGGEEGKEGEGEAGETSEDATDGANKRLAIKEEEIARAKKELREAEKPVDVKPEMTEEEKKEAEERRQQNIEIAKELVDGAEKGLLAMKDELKELAASQQKHAESLDAKEALATALKRELNKEKSELAGKIAAAITGLKNTTDKHNTVEQTISLLMDVRRTMGLVVTAFNDAVMFWKAIVTFCKRLVGMKEGFLYLTKNATELLEDVNKLGGTTDKGEALAKLLTMARCQDYIQKFVEEEAIIEDLEEMTEEDLTEFIPKRLPRKRLMRALAMRKTPEGQAKIKEAEEYERQKMQKWADMRLEEHKEAKQKLLAAKAQLVAHVMQSGRYWVAMGRVSYDANLFINEAKAKIDGVMNKLPTKVEMDRAVDGLVNQLLPNLQALKDNADEEVKAADKLVESGDVAAIEAKKADAPAS